MIDNIKKIAGILCATYMLGACQDVMDYKEYVVNDKELVDGNFSYVGGLMATVYRQLDYDYGQLYGGAMLASATDEAEYAYTGTSIDEFYNGAWSPSVPKGELWTSAYKGITYCNLVLDKFQGLTFPEVEVNDDYDKQMHRYENYKYEARWARAYFYFTLVRQYGGVPLVTSDITHEEANHLTRATADEIFKFIETECDDIKDKITADYNTDPWMIDAAETGRADRLTVLALKARAALYHASPLFNTNNDNNLWLQAALANKELIEEAEARGKKLATKYESLWSETNYSDADAAGEIIFARRVGSVATPESYNFPIGIEGGKGGNCPTQNLVDAYELNDKRFALTIAQNDDKWPSTNKNALQTYYGGANAQPLSGGTPTGYYLKKLCDSSIDLSADSKKKDSKHTWVTFRLGEFYLNYAEAVYKYLGDAEATTGELPMSAKEALQKTRERAGLGVLSSTDDFWEKYKNERFVELAFEGHRFWDVRRWKEADKYFKDIIELKLTKNDDGSVTSERHIIHRQWNDKMYLFPIPQSERVKNRNLAQNPGWDNVQ